MTEACPDQLIYGHFGLPSYDAENNAWHFSRASTTGPQLLPLEASRLVIASDNAQPNKDFLSLGPPDIFAANYKFPSILSNHVLQSSPTSSKDTAATPYAQDTIASSDLISFGKAIDRSRSKRAEPVPLLVAVSSSSKDLLKLVLLKKEHIGWERYPHVGFCRYLLQGAETGWWSARGATVQQLIFAADPHGQTTASFAARYGGNISIFRPNIKYMPVPSFSQNSYLPQSRIQANEVARLDWQDFGHAPFSDICFNPWDEYQFASVDQLGSWVVWSLQPPVAEKANWEVSQLFHGVGNYSEGNDPRDGEWASICWACDSRSLVLAGRRSLTVLALGKTFNSMEVTSLALDDKSDIILSMKQSPSLSGYIWILTTLNVTWIRIQRMDGSSKAITACTETPFETCRLLSWVHYLKLRREGTGIDVYPLSSTTEQASSATNIILLNSRVNHLLTVFTAEYDIQQQRSKSIADPYNLPMDSRASDPVLFMKLDVLTPGDLFGHPPSGRALEYVEKGFRFFQTVSMGHDFQLREGLHVLVPSGSRGNLPAQPQPLETRRPPRSLPNLGSKFVVDDDFVDPEGDSTIVSRETSPDSAGVDGPLDVIDPRTLNFVWLTALLRGTSLYGDGKPRKESTSSPQASRHAAGTLMNLKTADIIVPNTIYEIVKSLNPSNQLPGLSFKVEEVVESTLQVLDINRLSDISNEKILKLMPSPLIVATLKGLSNEETQLLYNILRTLYGEEETRIEEGTVVEPTDRDIWLVAGYLQLATYALDHSSSVDTMDHEVSAKNATNPDEEMISLPVRSGRPPLTSGANEKIERRETHQKASKDNSLDQQNRIMGTDPLPSALPGKFGRLLRQWQTGNDPEQCNWAELTRQLVTTEVEIDETDAESLRNGRRKRKRRSETMQSRDTLARRFAKEQVGGSQPLPHALSSSQPDLDTSQDHVSTQGSIMPEVSTQPVAGPHAQRLKAKHSGKPRKAGF